MILGGYLITREVSCTLFLRNSAEFPRLRSAQYSPNWHEAGQIYFTYNIWIGFCQHQKFLNIFSDQSDNWDNLTPCQAH